MTLGLAAQQVASPVDRRIRNRVRVASTRLELEREVAWGSAGLPALRREDSIAVSGMAFSGDGSWLALQRGEELCAIAPASGESIRIPTGGNTCVWESAPGAKVAIVTEEGLQHAQFPSGKLEPVFDSAAPSRRGNRDFVGPGPHAFRPDPSGRYSLALGRSVELYDREGPTVTLWRDRWVTAAAWHRGQSRLGAGTIMRDPKTRALDVFSVDVVDMSGQPIRSFPAKKPVWVLTFDPAGKIVYWVDDTLHSASLATGATREAKGVPQTWWCLVDPVLGLGLDGERITLWDAEHLEPVEHISLDETRPEDIAPQKLLPLWGGCVVGAAISPKRDRFALATYRGVRVYSIVR